MSSTSTTSLSMPLPCKVVWVLTSSRELSRLAALTSASGVELEQIPSTSAPLLVQQVRPTSGTRAEMTLVFGSLVSHGSTSYANAFFSVTAGASSNISFADSSGADCKLLHQHVRCGGCSWSQRYWICERCCRYQHGHLDIRYHGDIGLQLEHGLVRYPGFQCRRYYQCLQRLLLDH